MVLVCQDLGFLMLRGFIAVVPWFVCSSLGGCLDCSLLKGLGAKTSQQKDG